MNQNRSGLYKNVSANIGLGTSLTLFTEESMKGEAPVSMKKSSTPKLHMSEAMVSLVTYVVTNLMYL